MGFSNNKSVKRILVGATATVAALAVVGGVLWFDAAGDAHAAKSSLPGVERIVMNNAPETPFTIVEVVPTMQDAALGFFVNGQEPVIVDEYGNVRALADMADHSERAYPGRLPADDTGLSAKCQKLELNEHAFVYSPYADDGTDREILIRGSFKDVGAGNGDYKLSTATDVVKKYDQPTVEGDGKEYFEQIDDNYGNISDNFDMYRMIIDYTPNISAGTASIKQLSKFTGDNLPRLMSGDNYNWQYFVPSEISAFEAGQIIYTAPYGTDLSGDGATLTFFGITKIGAESIAVLTTNGTNEIKYEDRDSAFNYYVVSEQPLGDAGNYFYISDTTSGFCNPYSVSEHYAQPVNRNESGQYDAATMPLRDGGDNPLPYYYGSGAGTGYSYVGVGKGNLLFHQNYAIAPDTEGYYSVDDTYGGAFDNKEWLKKFVFDLENEEELKNMYIDVVTVTPSGLTDELLAKAGMLYFSGIGANYYTDDLTEKVAVGIVKSVRDNNLPVVMEKSTYSEPNESMNIAKMALLLNQAGAIPDPGTDTWATTLNWTNMRTSMFSAYGSPADGSHVNGSVFVNDDTVAGSKVVANDFNDNYSTEKTNAGFKAVTDTIESENFYLEQAKKDKLPVVASKALAMRHILNIGDSRTTVKSQLTILDLEPYETSQFDTFDKYGQITGTELNKNLVVKDPNSIAGNVNYMEARDIFELKWLLDNVAPQFTDQIVQRDEQADGTAIYRDKDGNALVTVKQMGTREFIGHIEDLNETYDMIFVGMDTALMNTEITLQRQDDPQGLNRPGVKTIKTVYNDSSMNGLIYTHVGDTYGYNMGGLDATQRLSGNDITRQKYEELVRYMRAGYPIILSDYFFTDGEKYNVAEKGISSNRTDRNSYMYKFINACTSDPDCYRKNVFRKKDLTKTAKVGNTTWTNNNYNTYVNSFSSHLNMSKLQVQVDEQPRDYNTEGYLLSDSAGVYSLDYKLTLKNDSAVSVGDTTYTCQLFIDEDADGRFEKDEELKDISISRNNGESVSYDSVQAGYQYSISRQIPEGYVGFVSWKLVFTQNGTHEDGGIRKSIQGYSAVPATSKPKIKVLQMSSETSRTTWYDLEKDHFLLDGSLDDARNIAAETRIKTLLQDVDDFDIEVTHIFAGDYVDKTVFSNTSMSYAEYLSQYDMLVMGFTDKFELTSETAGDDAKTKAALGIRQYAMSGRSVLFTHDLSSFNVNDKGWGYYFNTYLRDIQGMDRFGVTGTLSPEFKYQHDEKALVNSNDIKYKFGDAQALTNANILKYTNQWERYSETTRYGTGIYEWNGNKETVSQVNEGQITKYPYEITNDDNPTFKVANTHAQYFQLNLDTVDEFWKTQKSADGTSIIDEYPTDDVTVWYAMSNRSRAGLTQDNNQYNTESAAKGNPYRTIPNDVRNNYYIYTRDNIVYTGSGHGYVDGIEERKLFVNTLVAAYNAGTHAPSAQFKESCYSQASNITNMYLPVDTNVINDDGTLGSFVQDDSGKISINVRPKNPNIKGNSNRLYARFYRTASASDYDLKIGNSYYKSVPVTFTKMENLSGDLTQGGTITAPAVEADGGSYRLNNYTTYGMAVTPTDLGLKVKPDTLTKNNVTFYVRLGIEQFDTKNSYEILPAGESMNGLSVFRMELQDLE